MNDIIILSKYTEEYIHHVAQILTTLKEVGVALNLKMHRF